MFRGDNPWLFCRLNDYWRWRRAGERRHGAGKTLRLGLPNGHLVRGA
jgi:hypothetical protein